MRRSLNISLIAGTASLLTLCTSTGCEQYFFLPNGDGAKSSSGNNSGSTPFPSNGKPFTEVLIQGSTFINGSGVSTIMYDPHDASRIPRGIDFNADGKIDPIVAYDFGNSGVMQILLSKGPVGTVDFTSLTFDGNGRWKDLADVAAADIDGDGALDLIGVARDGVIYLHNPGPGKETNLRAWGAATPDVEFLAGSTEILTNDEIEAILTDALPPGTKLDDYDISVEQGYTRLTTGDLDGDGDIDVVASRRLKISLSPKQNKNVPPIEIIAGELQAFINPGGIVTTGENWTLISVGQHERYNEFDRRGASGIMLYDMDGDNDLDIVSAARDNDNVSIRWYENPGRTRINDSKEWTPWRIGSIRDALSIDIADLTGDGQPDVVAVGGQQKQLIMFEQPTTGAKREYDWDAHVLVTFSTFEPRDVKALDIDNDGKLELVVSGNLGQLRYFESPGDPRNTWTVNSILDFAEAGEVGWVGYGDLDGDGDLDLVATLNSSQVDGETADRVVWVKNELIP